MGAYHGTSPVNIASGQLIDIVLIYDAVTQTMTEILTDTTIQATYINTYTGINLASTLGSTALMGFTGADGGSTSTQTIRNF